MIRVRVAAPRLRGKNFSSLALIRNFHAYTLQDETSRVTVHVRDDGVTIYAPQHGVKQALTLDYVWLRDACQAPSSVQASSRQKLFHTTDIPLLRAQSQLLVDDARPVTLESASDPQLVVRFAAEHSVINAFTKAVSPGAVKQAKVHESRFPLSFLLQHIVPDRFRAEHGDVLAVGQSWDASSLAEHGKPSKVGWNLIEKDDTALSRLLTSLLRDGFVFVTDLPTYPTGTDPGADQAIIATLARRIGEIRHTFYGTLWDVQAMADSRNIAYTSVDLGMHMDLLYFQNPPRYQLLHMLRKQVMGGESMFVDSFRVAQRLWLEDRNAFHTLATTPVAFQYKNAGEHYYFLHPTIELAKDCEGFAGDPLDESQMPRIVAVNYSPPFQAPLPLHAPNLKTLPEREEFYRALNKFAELTLAPEMTSTHALREGECVVFDNRRILHARRSFDWDPSRIHGSVGRWLKGAYVEGDSVWSRWRSLRSLD
ncbi:heme o synthase [Malassezia yamatoensis]|uniref:Heme o synthase n=1 Tax=Malassezia yamatoensis TaxID=253288 RepID=A0AAJ5YTE6_9BASI|nr:heme o synthase [Malassezia yamatoensis]